MENRPKKTILLLTLYALAGVMAQVIGESLSNTADMLLTAGTVVTIAITSAFARRNVLLSVLAFSVANTVTMLFMSHS